MINRVLDRLDTDFEHSLQRLFSLLRYPSISTDPAFAAECCQAADWLVDDLQSIGFVASRRDTAGHPIVVAHHEGVDKDAPHILFYGHYDVQPVDPLSLWQDPPFDPRIKEQNGHQVISGRGSSDDKGQLMTFIEAVRAWKQEMGYLPVRITLLLEGEEESGSPSLPAFLAEYGTELRADCAFICDTSMWDRKTPAISASLRGLVGEEVVIKAANRDLHSGLYGGAAANPIHILTRILGQLHDAEGRVTLPDFYEGVIDATDEMRKNWEKLGFDAQHFLAPIGLSVPAGERGRSLAELVWTCPTAEVNGICGGYNGDGFKTVIPAEASAKISFRLVGRQNPLKIREAFRDFVRKQLPEDCSVTFLEHGTAPAIQLLQESPFVKATEVALMDEWQNPVAFIGMGGSIPVVSAFRSELGMESVLVGFALDDDYVHSPNENYDLASFYKGQRSWARILFALGQISGKSFADPVLEPHVIKRES